VRSKKLQPYLQAVLQVRGKEFEFGMIMTYE